MTCWLRIPWIDATFAILVVCAAAAPADAQRRHMVEVGGGFYAAVPQGDITLLPSVPTVDTRIVRWWNRSWGVSGRVLVGIGSLGPEDDWTLERNRLTYLHALVRYRRALTRNYDLHVGFGGGLLSWRETFDGGDAVRSEMALWPHWGAVEVLVSRAVTERLSIRAGVTSVMVPLHLHPVVLAAYKF